MRITPSLAAFPERYARLFLVGIVVIITGCKPAEPAAHWNPRKQESKSLMLCGRKTHLFVDHTKAPSLLQVQFAVDGNTLVHYRDLQIHPMDQAGHEVSIRAEQASDAVIGGFSNGRGQGYTASAQYYFTLKQGQCLVLITITRQGETQKFELFPSNLNLLGYSD